jgi:hydroxyacylglutathione hydrolase
VSGPSVVTVSCPVHSFVAYSYFIDADEPALVDTAIAASPERVIRPALVEAGNHIEDVRWILLTHGHPDHAGGVAETKQATGGVARIAVHESDADLVRHRAAHADELISFTTVYFGAEIAEGVPGQLDYFLGGEAEPDLLLKGGEILELGGATIDVLATPGHSPGAVTYWLRETGRAFVGDSVQLGGGIFNRFPSYVDPIGYRTSLQRLLELKPRTLSLAHNFVAPDDRVVGGDVEGEAEVRKVLREALDVEARIADAVDRNLNDSDMFVDPRTSAYSPFDAIARDLGYEQDPTRFPSPFFTTLDGYARARGITILRADTSV